jgi:GTP-binding protein EngB required for normal cell division
MPRLAEGITRFFGRVEILARGVENERRAAEIALARGRALEAREHAREILARVPGSPLGLALWADAAEDAWLDHEVVTALSELSREMPWRADVWLRLARAGRRIEWPGARDALERAAAAPDERASAREALLDLCDLDLAGGDPARAQRWLDRAMASLGGGNDRELSLRRAECALARGDLEVAATATAQLGEDSPSDGRAALVRARLALSAGETPRALDLGLRAYLLDVRGARDFLTAVVAASHDAVVVDRTRRLVAAMGHADAPAWAAAFAFAEGRREDARRALEQALVEGEAGAAAALLRLATEARDMAALDALAARAPDSVPTELRVLREAAALLAAGDEQAALDRLDDVAGDAAAWAADLRQGVVAAWIPVAPPAAGDAPPPAARWPSLLRELRHSARELDRLDLLSGAEALAVERERPLRVAVVGEFNAGKSTFLNALLGVDVAPTGVLPTTATLHWVAWAPDPFARVVVRGAQDRVVPHKELKATLRALQAEQAEVSRVFIYAPIERLKRVEILDTPGFNAPDPDHIAAARQAFDEAHVAIWLLDATQPIKDSERKVLAEIKALGVPVQILANKADRLAVADRERVLEHIRSGLAEAGMRSHAPPLAFSARLSLAGKLGDAAALEASSWSEVEALIAREIVDKSEALRERALRRKATRIAVELAGVAATKAAGDRSVQRARREQTERMRTAAAQLYRQRTTLAESIDRSLEDARRSLHADLRPLSAFASREGGGDVVQAAPDGARAYAEERLVARLAEPVTQAIAEAAAVLVPPRAGAAVRATLAGAAAAHEQPSVLADRPLGRIVEACIDAFAAALAAESVRVDPPAPSAALEQRAEALRAALQAAAPADEAVVGSPDAVPRP